jgi:hypothetical protein
MALHLPHRLLYRRILVHIPQNLQDLQLTFARRKYASSSSNIIKSAFLKKINKPLVVEESKSSTKLKPGQVRIRISIWNLQYLKSR